MYILLLLNILLSGGAHAETLKLNDLHVSNRAQCALDSKSPSTSAFLILDGYNPGRLAHNVAKSVNQDSDIITQQAMLDFRMSVGQLQKIIISKLLAQKLPLLPSDLNTTPLKKYAAIAQSCHNEVYCADLSRYLRNIWESADNGFNLKQFDGYSEKNYLPAGFDHGCYLLKKFSPLQSHLYGTTVTREQLTNIGSALSNTDSFMVACDSNDVEIDSRYSAMQIDILGDQKVWNRYGFDFWNSVKIYTSWAWRNIAEINSSSHEFASVFKNLDLEESLLFISNGCKSLTRPECSSENLTMNSLRELAKSKVQTDEFNQLIPDGPEKQLLAKGARSVNDDFLSLMDYDKASKWVENFKTQFIDTQWLYRNKIMYAQQNLSLIASQFSPEELSAAVATLTQKTDEYPNLKKEITYLCTEWQLSANQDFDFIYSSIAQVPQISVMNEQSATIGLSIQDQIEYFKKMSKPLGELCAKLEKEHFFVTDSAQDNSGLADWAKEMLKKVQPEDEENPAPSAPTLMKEGNFLATGQGNVTVCVNATDCARRVLKSAVDLMNVSAYASGFLHKGHVGSSEMFNPYNELTTCNAYDPWFQKDRTRKRFFADLANVALFGWNNIPAYIDVDFAPDKVTSFKSLVEDGTLKFAPQVDKSKALYSILADLGPLAGAPCAIQYSPNADKAFNFYAFGGVAVNVCKVKSEREISFKKANDPVRNTPQDRSFCGGCVLNFIGVSSAVSHREAINAFNPLKLGVYIFRALYRFFKGMHDDVNIPRSYDLSLNTIKQTYDTFGKAIPEQCVKDLSQNHECRVNYCEGMASVYLEKNSHWTGTHMTTTYGTIKETPHTKRMMITDKECGNKHEVWMTCDEKTKTANLIKITDDHHGDPKCAAQKGGY